MIELELKLRIKSGVDLYCEGAYQVKDLYMHVYTIIKDHNAENQDHKKQCELLIFKTEGLLLELDQLLAGKKSKIVACKDRSSHLKKNIDHLLKNGYSVEYLKGKVKENELFK